MNIAAAAFAACTGFAALVSASAAACASAVTRDRQPPWVPGVALSEASLRARVTALAADSMRGRRAGTEDNVKATAYIAGVFRAIGLEPAGDSGTFFQYVPLRRLMLPDSSAVLSLAGRALRPFMDYLPRNNGSAAGGFSGAETVFGGVWSDTSALLSASEVGARVVVIAARPGQTGVNKPQLERRYAQAAAICVVNLDPMPVQVRRLLASSPLDTSPPSLAPLPAYFHISNFIAEELFGAPLMSVAPGTRGSSFAGEIRFTPTTIWARNVVAVLRGSDPLLRGQYVAVGAHNDHEGVDDAVDADSARAFNLAVRRRYLAGDDTIIGGDSPIVVNMDSIRRVHPRARLDSIYNGADDNASGTAGMLEVARALALSPAKPRRSILFVSHTAEELGLIGSQWFTDHPTVPLDSIVAHVNLDMIGRGGAGEEKEGGPDYLQLIGSRRLSKELGDLVENISRVNGYRWRFDYQYDADGHPEQYYCRSDHVNYARHGIPVVFMTTGNHADYHQVTDGPEFIDYSKLAKVSMFVRDVVEELANRDTRVRLDGPKPDPRAACVQ